ncbi:MAG: DNA mismatch repair endonuclease MutL [Endomicrobium sp.]|jgi:DNA mismatch repair protein MutL|nr:DNA mismatch repair endonuclease MutL [Endomicrobium sp.]
MPINILSQDTINKIAAGEVVERPLNVVKELVENSLDAFASYITVEIEGAGRKLIRVSDNGCGMDKKDLELSVLRHATSKIESFEDLAHIYTMGFRGEALSSIAAVSNFNIKTRKKGGSSGWKLSSSGGGKHIDIVPCSVSDGTVTEVRDLFFNVPVRQKFLKSESTERSRIISSLEEVAFANPEISFKMLSGGRTVFSYSKAGSRIERISDILGRDFSKGLMNVKVEHQKIILDIYFTGRDNCPASKKFQYFFVNSRPVNYPRQLIYCVYQAYRESIPRDRHPGILIYVTIDSSQIDVNIHPAKREVKFADEQSIGGIIFKSLKNALISHACPEIKINPVLDKSIDADNSAEKLDSCEMKINSAAYKADIPNPHPPRVESAFIHGSGSSIVAEPSAEYNHKNYSIDKYVNVFKKQKELVPERLDENINVLGQVFNTYVIVEYKGSLYIFDQHAAAERIRYEAYLCQTQNMSLKMQQLLIPETFDMSAGAASVLKANIDIFNKLGIIIEEFGQNSFRITAYPSLLGNISVKQVVEAVISDIEDDKNAEIKEKTDKIIRSACRASVKAGDTVSFSEVKKMINDLFKCSHPFTCPHGRPTAYKISLNELEKFFKRK